MGRGGGRSLIQEERRKGRESVKEGEEKGEGGCEGRNRERGNIGGVRRAGEKDIRDLT